jgi:AhpD family alkylhydroperoxidase
MEAMASPKSSFRLSLFLQHHKEVAMLAETIWERLMRLIQYVTPVSYGSATGTTAQVYQQVQADFMPAPLVVLHAPVPEVMAGVWSILRETLLAGSADRAYKEVVAALISKANVCPYCVDAHTMMLHASSSHDVVNAILSGHYDRITDPQHLRLIQWVLSHQTEVTPHELPPFSRDEAPEIIGTAIAFHYINRMVNIFLGDSLLTVPSALKGVTRRLVGIVGKKFVRRLESGLSLPFVSQAPLPDDFSWAAANPTVATAFAGWINAVEVAGEHVLPEPVRRLVGERVSLWQGEPLGMSRRWVDEAVAPLKIEHQPAARLVLLTALASYQVDAGLIRAFRAQYPDDDQLIAATAWASLTATRRVSVWMAAPFIMMETK